MGATDAVGGCEGGEGLLGSTRPPPPAVGPNFLSPPLDANYVLFKHPGP